MITDALYAVTILGSAGLLWDGWRRYLAQEAKDVAALKAELSATQADWEKRFVKYERAHDQLVTRVNNANPGPNPLGKTYSTRSAG